MFVRVKAKPNNKKSVQIVKNVRTGHKIKQVIVHHVGMAIDENSENKMKALAQELITKFEREEKENQLSFVAPLSVEEEGKSRSKQSEKRKAGRRHAKKLEDVTPPEQVTLTEVVETDRLVEGIHEIGGIVYQELGFDKIFTTKRQSNLLKDLVLARTVCPESKLKLNKTLRDKFDKDYDVNKLYRLMDKLNDKIPTIKKLVYNRSAALFPKDGVQMMFYDVTTLYMECFGSDGFREKGFGKDGKNNQPQLVFALCTNTDGLPIGYELFEGNKAEVKTLVDSIENWKKLFNIGLVTFVGDRAMFSDENLSLLEKYGYTYVIAACLKKLSEEFKKQITDKANYTTIKVKVKNKSKKKLKDTKISIAEFDRDGRRLIVSYKESRAECDAKKRNKKIEKLRKQLASGNKVKKFMNSGKSKYLTTSGTTCAINEKTIKQEEAWDGIHGVITNIQHEEPLKILSKYGRLHIIEDAFRVHKTNLKIRPVFHWKKRRLESHIALCYMSFAIIRNLQYKIGLVLGDENLSVHEILEELLEVQASIYTHKETKDRYRVPGKFSHKASKIYRVFGILRSQDAEVYLPNSS